MATPEKFYCRRANGVLVMSELGRPSSYSAELAVKICAELAQGRSLRDVCSDEGMPSESTVRSWAVDDREGFSAHYARAREIGYHAMADELMDIADDGRNDWMERRGDGEAGWQANGEHIQRSRLRVDARKWMLSKVLPKIYGDKQEVDHKSSDGSMTPQKIELVALMSEDVDDDSPYPNPS